MLIDGYELNALIDTGADYSVISYELAKKLKKVLTEWNGHQIRTAGGHLVMPSAGEPQEFRYEDLHTLVNS